MIDVTENVCVSWCVAAARPESIENCDRRNTHMSAEVVIQKFIRVITNNYPLE